MILAITAICMAVISKKKAGDKEDKKGDGYKEETTEMTAEEIFKDMEYSVSYKKENANNPIYTQRFGADPGVMEYDGRIYIYTTDDILSYDSNNNPVENNYSLIKTINCVSSDDLVNWTDHGAIKVAGPDGAAKWAGNSWAPCAAHKTIDGKEMFYLFFANGGNGICVLTSESPTGPWTDPLGKPLITREIKGCEDVIWLFDPAILTDDNGSSYLYFGGGIPDEEFANPGTARVVKLSEDLLSLEGDVQKIDVPYLFEDSCINKINGKYYYSYCSNFTTDGNALGLHGGAIQYMVSDNPMGPFEYVGEVFENPGVFFNLGGNNHHTIFEFNNEFYIAYHARTVEKAMGITGNYRSTHIDKLEFKDGQFAKAKGTYEGVSQIKNFNPYKVNLASTMSDNGGITVNNDKELSLDVQKGNWIKVSNVDFGNSSKSLTVRVKSDEKTYIKICQNNKENEKAFYLEIPSSDGKYMNITADTDMFKGTGDLYFVFAGTMSITEWNFETDELTVDEPKSLKEVYADKIVFGMCLNPNTIAEKYKSCVVNNFSSVTCENEMKPDCILNKELCLKNVQEDRNYVAVSFENCRKIIEYCQENGLVMRYHTLVWQNQTPDWFFYEDYDTGKQLTDKETMKKRMENYINQVIAYFDKEYPGLIYTIDVVNEAFNGDGEYKVQEKNNKWYEIFGSEYVYYAFYYTKNAINQSENMKNVTLVYNDYNMLYKENTVYDGLTGIFMEKGADVHDYVDAIGFQGHIDIKTDITKYTSIMQKYSDRGFEIQITELDAGIPKVKVGDKPTKEQYIEQGKYVKNLMTAINNLVDNGCNISAITIWGINDTNSWRKNVDGYNAFALFWNDDMSPKPSLRGLAGCDDVVSN